MTAARLPPLRVDAAIRRHPAQTQERNLTQKALACPSSSNRSTLGVEAKLTIAVRGLH